MNIGLETGGIGCTPSSTPSLNENEGTGGGGTLQVVARPKRYVSILPRPINQPQKGVINWEVSAVDQDKDPNWFQAEKPHAKESAVQDMMATSLSPTQDALPALCENKKGCKRKKGSQESRIQLRKENERVAAQKRRDRVKRIRQQNETTLKNHGVGLPVKDNNPSISSLDVINALRRDKSFYQNLFYQKNQFNQLVDFIAEGFSGGSNYSFLNKKAVELAGLLMPENEVSVDGLLTYRKQIRDRISTSNSRSTLAKYDNELRGSVIRLKRSGFSVSEQGGSGAGTLINIDEKPGSDNGEMIKPALIDTSSGVSHDTDGQSFFDTDDQSFFDMVGEFDFSMETGNDFHTVDRSHLFPELSDGFLSPVDPVDASADDVIDVDADQSWKVYGDSVEPVKEAVAGVGGVDENRHFSIKHDFPGRIDRPESEGINDVLQFSVDVVQPEKLVDDIDFLLDSPDCQVLPDTGVRPSSSTIPSPESGQGNGVAESSVNYDSGQNDVFQVEGDGLTGPGNDGEHHSDMPPVVGCPPVFNKEALSGAHSGHDPAPDFQDNNDLIERAFLMAQQDVPASGVIQEPLLKECSSEVSSQQLGSRAMCFEPGISIKGPVYMAFNSNHSVSVIPAAGKLPIERLPDSKAVDQSPHKMKKKASDAEKKMASRHQAQRSRDSKKAAIADQEKRIKEMAKRMGSAIDLKEKKGEPCVTTEDEYKRRIDHWVKNPQRKHELKIVTTYSVDALSKWFVEADKAMAQGQRGKKIFTDLRGTDVDCQSIHQLHKAIKNQIFSAHSLAGQSHYQSCLNVIESELVTALANKGKASALLPDNPEPS